METFLDQVKAYKLQEVETRRREVPLAELEEAA